MRRREGWTLGYPQLLHLYPPEEILVGPGIAPEEVEEIFVEALTPGAAGGVRRARPSRAPVCGYDRHP